MTPFSNFIKTLQSDYPDLNFRPGNRFLFRPPKTIHYDQYSTLPLHHQQLLTLHELGHALSGLYDYQLDIERLKIETKAWEIAHQLCPKYHLSYDSDFAETELDSYRNWLHQRSLCPHCKLNRFQTTDKNYHCPHCELL